MLVQVILLSGYISLATPVVGPSKRTLWSSAISTMTAILCTFLPNLIKTSLPGSTNLLKPYICLLNHNLKSNLREKRIVKQEESEYPGS